MKRVFLSVFFTVFLRLQIYESIAAIFWQSASYVYTLATHVIIMHEKDVF